MVVDVQEYVVVGDDTFVEIGEIVVVGYDVPNGIINKPSHEELLTTS